MTAAVEARTPDTITPTREDDVGSRILELCADVEGFARRRLGTAGTSAVLRDELRDLASAAAEIAGDVIEILWTQRDRWTSLCAEDQRRWTFGIARNLVARRLKTARAAHIHHSTTLPLLDDPGIPNAVDPRLTALAALRLLVESQLGDAAWATIAEAIRRNHSPGLRADVAAALECFTAGCTPSTRAIVRRCRIDWRPWALASLDAGEPLRPTMAVELGLFSTLVEATSTLSVWWVEQRAAFDQPFDAVALAASGLVDHLGRTLLSRSEAAAGLLSWISRERRGAYQAA
jgi:DNA-directed RNA polymerase specialized sigma24 family protein